MRLTRIFVLSLMTAVSLAVAGQSNDFEKIMEKYKKHPEVMYTEKRNPETKEVLKREIILNLTDDKEIKELYATLDGIIEKGDYITDIMQNKNIREVNLLVGKTIYNFLVTNKDDEKKVVLILSEKPKKSISSKFRSLEGLDL